MSGAWRGRAPCLGRRAVEQLSPQAAFVTRLRRYRQRTGISLDEIAAETRVNREHLDAFEQNRLTTWPKGLYARAWIRATIASSSAVRRRPK